MSWSHRFAPRSLLAGAVTVAALSLGVVAPSALAASPASAAPSAFCKTVLSFPTSQPSTSKVNSYKAYLKRYLPVWEKLAAEAPNAATKNVLSKLVAVMKSEYSFTSATQFEAYVGTHTTQWVNGWKAFAKALLQCELSKL